MNRGRRLGMFHIVLVLMLGSEAFCSERWRADVFFMHQGLITPIDINKDGIDEMAVSINKSLPSTPLSSSNVMFGDISLNWFRHINFGGIAKAAGPVEWNGDPRTWEVLTSVSVDTLLYVNVTDFVNDKNIVIENIKKNSPYPIIRNDIICVNFVGEVEIDTKGNKFVILGIHSGYTRYPRGLVALDSKTFEVRWKKYFGTEPLQYEFVDFNDDGLKELLVGSGAPSNGADYGGFNDTTSYLIMVNPKNGKILNSKAVGYTFTSVRFRVADFDGDGEPEILAAPIHGTTPKDEERETPIYILSKDFEVKKVLHFKNKTLRGLETIDVDNNGIPEILFSDGNSLTLLDSELKEIKRVPFKRLTELMDVSDLNSDGKPEIVLWDRGGFLVIMNKNFKPLLKYNIGELVPDVSPKGKIKYLHVKNMLYPIFYKEGNESYIIKLYLEPVFPLFGIIISLILTFVTGGTLGYFSYRKHSLNLLINTGVNTGLPCAVVDRKDKIVWKSPYWENSIKNDNLREITRKGSFRLITPYAYSPEKLKQLESQINIVQRILHDTKNHLSYPLNVLQHKLMGKYTRKKEIEKAIEEISRVVEELKKVNEILAPIGETTELNLRDLLENIRRLYRYMKREIKLEFEDYNGKYIVSGNSDAIEKAFKNIINNSIEAGATEIRIRVGNTVRFSKSYVVIEFVDNGRGIPSEVMKKLFKSIVTTKEGGSGTGLFIAKRVIEDHQGFLEIKSEVNNGTRVIVYLPIFEANEA